MARLRRRRARYDRRRISALAIVRILHLPIRSACRFVASLFKRAKIGLPVPNYPTVCRSFTRLNVDRRAVRRSGAVDKGKARTGAPPADACVEHDDGAGNAGELDVKILAARRPATVNEILNRIMQRGCSIFTAASEKFSRRRASIRLAHVNRAVRDAGAHGRKAPSGRYPAFHAFGRGLSKRLRSKSGGASLDVDVGGNRDELHAAAAQDCNRIVRVRAVRE